jgi:hypothetical protein
MILRQTGFVAAMTADMLRPQAACTRAIHAESAA